MTRAFSAFIAVYFHFAVELGLHHHPDIDLLQLDRVAQPILSRLLTMTHMYIYLRLQHAMSRRLRSICSNGHASCLLGIAWLHGDGVLMLLLGDGMRCFIFLFGVTNA